MADVKGLARTVWFLPAWGVALWWTVRLGITGRVTFETAIAVGSLLNFGILLALTFLSDFRSERGADFGIRFKQNLQSAVLYAVMLHWESGLPSWCGRRTDGLEETRAGAVH